MPTQSQRAIRNRVVAIVTGDTVIVVRDELRAPKSSRSLAATASPGEKAGCAGFVRTPVVWDTPAQADYRAGHARMIAYGPERPGREVSVGASQQAPHLAGGAEVACSSPLLAGGRRTNSRCRPRPTPQQFDKDKDGALFRRNVEVPVRGPFRRLDANKDGKSPATSGNSDEVHDGRKSTRSR